MKNEKHPHKAAVLATAMFREEWRVYGEVSAVAFYNDLSEDNKSYVNAYLADIMQAADVPQPAKIPLLSAVEILRDHNEWRKANSEDEAPMPYPHSAELVGRAMERVCELVPEYQYLAQLISDTAFLNPGDFNRKYPIFATSSNPELWRKIANEAKALLEK